LMEKKLINNWLKKYKLIFWKFIIIFTFKNE